MDFDLVDLLIRVPIVLLALTVHEFCHAYVAWRLGDPTAMRLGRCTLNPLKHLEPLGTICLLFAPIGWAKPVPVNPLNFHDPRKGDLYTSAAGPLSNLAQAVLFALLLRGVIHFLRQPVEYSTQQQRLIEAAYYMFRMGVAINVGLAVFNFLPLYPLDGFHVTLQLMSPDKQQEMLQYARFGPFVIVGLVMVGSIGHVDLLGKLVGPPTMWLLRYVAGLNLA